MHHSHMVTPPAVAASAAARSPAIIKRLAAIFSNHSSVLSHTKSNSTTCSSTWRHSTAQAVAARSPAPLGNFMTPTHQHVDTNSTTSMRCFSTASSDAAAQQAAPLVLAANVYISEGRNQTIIQQLESVVRSHPQVLLANLFVDEPYNRTGFTLTSTSPSQLSLAASQLATAALQRIDLTAHIATHPRLGVADHVCVQPLAWPGQGGGPEASRHTSANGPCPRVAALMEAAAVAQQVGAALSPLCPVYYYGSAHPSGRALADVRRSLGYFKPDARKAGGNMWEGPLGVSSLEFFPPDVGEHQVHAQSGVATIGAVPFIVNYNVPIVTSDLKLARDLARAVSTRGGGLPYVEAMALQHTGCMEVACNLLDVEASPPEAVQAYLEQAVARQYGGTVQVQRGYTTGKSAEELVGLTLAAEAAGR